MLHPRQGGRPSTYHTAIRAEMHPSEGRQALQQSRIRVEEGGELHIYNEPVIPFAGARLSQTTLIDVAKGSRLYFWESLMAGRIGSGEIWQFDAFSSETRLRSNNQLLYLDRFRLVPREDRLIAPWTMGNARYHASGLCFDDRANDFAEKLHDAMPDAGVDTPTAGLSVVRVATVDGLSFHRAMAAFKSVTLA
jgi:urease accessory protein UreH